MTSEITYYTPAELRASAAEDDEAARTKFIEESGDQLVGGFYHRSKGDEWIVRRLGPDQYLVTGSEFERRYDDGLVYDTYITPRLMAAYEDGLKAKLAAMGADPDHPLAAGLLINGQRTRACEAYCHPARAGKVRDMIIDNDEWDAVRGVIERAEE